MFFLMPPLPTTSTLFPYTTLFRSTACLRFLASRADQGPAECVSTALAAVGCSFPHELHIADSPASSLPGDRKSTRLNSSHLGISYAVFCLKKKTRRAYLATQ